MKQYAGSLLIFASLGMHSVSGQSGSAQSVEVESGMASFSLSTNVPAIEVSGKSKAVQAHVVMHSEASGIVAERIEARMPIKSLQTGMALRDEHMRKMIFTTPAGDTPDLRFEGGKTECPGAGPGHDTPCTIAGILTLRGVSHAFTIAMKVRLDNGGTSFRAIGDGVVKLSDYGIEQPSQLGVKGSNDVKLRLDLSGKAGKETVALASARRP
ncbi:MAG: YceI family protein [Acidobacteriota bacterium]|nr:YceI family protein [Acidobacteriota bacterium]